MVNPPEDPVRALIDRLIRDRRDDYTSLSRLLGRNPAYIQQFIKRGIPRKLDENDRRVLARYFDIAEELLGGPVQDNRPMSAARPALAVKRADGLVLVPYLSVQASAGPGAVPHEEDAAGRLGFSKEWLRELSSGGSAGLSVIRVKGDSMSPTLSDGDDILIDRNDAADRLRDGIYVLRVDDMLNVKRIAMHPAGQGFEIHSDNPSYPVWRDCDPESVTIIGRVVWAGRRIS